MKVLGPTLIPPEDGGRLVSADPVEGARSSERQPTSRILIVEDDVEEARFLLDTIEARLGSGGAEVTASVGRALELLEERSFDCVIQAFDLPDRHGIELVRGLRERGHGLPVVLRTDRDAEPLKESARAAGVDAILSKDDDRGDVRGTVEALLGRGTRPAPAER